MNVGSGVVGISAWELPLFCLVAGVHPVDNWDFTISDPFEPLLCVHTGERWHCVGEGMFE